MRVEPINQPIEITDATVRQYLADCSSVVRNAQPKDNNRLFDRLLKESYGNKPSRVFEYIPCRMDQDKQGRNPFEVTSQFFGFFNTTDESQPMEYYTNARELLNWGLSWEEVLALVDFTHYRAVKVTAPYFLYGQASTHNQITSVSHSNRYTESGLGYWMPEEARGHYTQEEWNTEIATCRPNVLQEHMKGDLGIKRREVYARGSDMLAYRVFTLGGYTNNPNAWPHFINQRLHDPHTQMEMRDLAGWIEECIK